MGYTVKVTGAGARPLIRKYGRGVEGKGGVYLTRNGADARAKKLRREFPPKKGFVVTVVRS